MVWWLATLSGESIRVSSYSSRSSSVACSVLQQRGFFDTVTPVNFNTFATPHIGLPRYPSIMSSLFSSLGPKLLSRTGEQFYCVDRWSATGRPLIEVMADPGMHTRPHSPGMFSKYNRSCILSRSSKIQTSPNLCQCVSPCYPHLRLFLIQ